MLSYRQCCGSGTGFNGVPLSVCGSGSKREKITHKHRKKLINFIWSAGCSLFRAEGFSCSLDISKLQFLKKKKYKRKHFFCIFFFSFWSSKPWIRIGSGFTWNARSGSGFTALLTERILWRLQRGQLFLIFCNMSCLKESGPCCHFLGFGRLGEYLPTFEKIICVFWRARVC